MLVLAAAFIVTLGLAWVGLQIAKAAGASAADALRQRVVQILVSFAPALDAAARDPRAIIVWQPLARAARQLCVEEFAMLDRATGAAFPFSRDRIEAGHARWTADWLAWERVHDGEYKLKAAAIEAELATSGSSPLIRARLDAIEREKLDLYQRRYEEYIRVAKALQALIE
ncbi:MAG: hypothetical protein WBD07_15760 [Vicinamibacterales bacterium]